MALGTHDFSQRVMAPLGQHIGKPIPNNSLTQRELLHRPLTTCLFNPNHQGFIRSPKAPYIHNSLDHGKNDGIE
jgi:hypothetical protein